MDILVTGGAGFLGTRLVRALLTRADKGTSQGFERIHCLDLVPSPVEDDRVISHVGDLADGRELEKLVTGETGAVFHLAAVVSGQAEAEFETGMRANLDGTRALLDACRRAGSRPFFFFSSSLAVFGEGCPEVVGDAQVLQPRSSYGTQKAIGEMLVADYTRKGFVDGVAARLPTVVIRPGRPNRAASSFMSSILREPLAGEPAVCPVPEDAPLWIASPDSVVANMLALFAMDRTALGGMTSINLPGITVTPRSMLDALERAAGPQAVARVAFEPDETIAAIVLSWPSRFDVARAVSLGLHVDAGIDAIISAYRSA